MIYSAEQLNNKEFLEKVKFLTQDIISEDRFREAYDLAKNLEQSLDAARNFKEKNYELYREYKDIIIKLYWVGLPIMVEDKVIHMFRYYFTAIFKISNYDIWQKLRTVLLSIIMFEDRDKFKQQLINALMANQQSITKNKIVLDNQEKSPTVSNWIKDYNKTLGTGVVNKLARTQYLIDGKNIRKLTEQEKNQIKALFNLYEKLKLSSLTLEGLEEDIPVDENDMKGIIRAGIFEPHKEMDKKLSQIIFGRAFVKDNAEKFQSITGESMTASLQSPIDSLEQKAIKEEKEKEDQIDELVKLVNQYPEGSLERKAVRDEIEKLKS